MSVTVKSTNTFLLPTIIKIQFTLLFLLPLLSSCSSLPTVTKRIQHTDELTQKHNWNRTTFTTESFDIVGYLPNKLLSKRTKTLTIYIEGDGLSWVTSRKVSSNPTPINPVALRLALQHPDTRAAYLARPCQFTVSTSKNCTAKYWTNARFSVEVINAMNQAVQQLVKESLADSIVLVGYSGGAAVAALIAAQRDDVEMLVTVAGNLDHRKWTEIQNLSPLDDSLNPVDYIQQLSHVKQVHLVGDKDQIMPKSVVDSYIEGFAPANKPMLKVMKNYDHNCCWTENWKSIWNTINENR